MRRFAMAVLAVALVLCGCQKTVDMAEAPEPVSDPPEISEPEAVEVEPETVDVSEKTVSQADAVSVADEPEKEIPTLSEDVDYAAIRALAPFEGLNPWYWNSPDIPSFIDENDVIGMRLQYYAEIFGIGDRSYESVDELDEYEIVGAAIHAITPYSTYPDSYFYYPEELEPIPTLVYKETASSIFWLQEHVQQAIPLLFGEYTVEDYRNVSTDVSLHEILGVYYSPPRGGGLWPIIPIVFGYEDLGDKYCAEVAYILVNVATYQNPSTGEAIVETFTEDDTLLAILTEYLLTKSNRYHLYLLKQDESLIFEKQLLIE